MYTTTANIAARLGTSLTNDQAMYFASVLDSGIDALIEEKTGTRFGSTEVVEVYVSGDGSDTLIIPTMHDITSVARITDDDTEEALSVDEYRTVPRGLSKPTKLALKHLTGSWEEGTDNYMVTGKLGYAEIPADITMVATEMAVSAMKANVNNYKSERVGDWSVTYNDEKQPLSAQSEVVLNNYRRLSQAV